MRRLAEFFLDNWLKKENRKPLIIRGARQVGKSTLVRLFSEKQKLNLIEVNLEKRKLKSVEQEEINLSKVLSEIQALYNVDINKNYLLFFDEIQSQPKLFLFLRYFYEERPDIPVIAAGSLLEFVLEEHDFSMPVGRIEYYHLGPMTFKEFLIAKSQLQLIKQIETDHLNLENYHKVILTEYLKEFLFVGGMPEAVQEFIKSRNPSRVRDIHRSIVRTYQDDFPKYSKKSQFKNIYQIFERLPLFIGQKIKYSEFMPDLQSRDIKSCFQILNRARILLTCYHSNCSGLPLSSQKDLNVFKQYFLDVGLLNYLQGTQWEQIINYEKEGFLTKGEIAEQFVAQHLSYLDQGLEEPSLFYWLRDKKSNKAEIDFVIARSGRLIPIEVKSGRSTRLKSAIQFTKEKNAESIFRFDLDDHKNSQEIIKIEKEDGTLKEISISNYHLAMISFLKC